MAWNLLKIETVYATGHFHKRLANDFPIYSSYVEKISGAASI
jgi:hypothetical protein